MQQCETSVFFYRRAFTRIPSVASQSLTRRYWFSKRLFSSYALYSQLRAFKSPLKTFRAHLYSSLLLKTLEGRVQLSPQGTRCELFDLPDCFYSRVGSQVSLPCVVDGTVGCIRLFQTNNGPNKEFYWALRLLDQGSVGEVFEGVLVRVSGLAAKSKSVALKMARSAKVLSEEPLYSPRAHSLIREAALLRELHGEGVLTGVQEPPLNTFTADGGDHWMTCVASELYDGDARSLVPRERLSEDQMGTRLRHVQPLIEGLRAIHGQGFLHGDLDLRNIFFKGSRLVVADFGNARRVPEGEDGQRKTKSEVRDLGRVISSLLLPAEEALSGVAVTAKEQLEHFEVPERQSAVLARAVSRDESLIPSATEFYGEWSVDLPHER